RAPQEEEGEGDGEGDENNQSVNSGGGQSQDKEKDDSSGGQSKNKDKDDSGFSLEEYKKMIEDWQNVSRQMQMDLETFSKEHGDSAGCMMQNLAAVNREKYDYTAFLKKFAVLGEAMKVNDDEFDYIFYTYGLNMYGKMPLIEPLEYKEVKRIKEFVIAIDTSGSVSGPLVQKFLQKTYNILKQEESFFTKINLHIIQCDAEIHEDKKITSQEEFDNYLENMTLKGFGGTDFRPVFHYVDELVKNKEFTNLKGLIYFTDGYGVFPKRQPDYNTAFVFVEDEYGIPEVPVWAIKLVLQSDEV
ncbi:MAG: VWA-like domain-containing protein, partial [Lachnospiraceae bacterium]|nr:VWA-like domain-containing protein [Lachnospiraceae bacterium]